MLPPDFQPELTDVPAGDILKQIENGEDVSLYFVNITGKLDLSKIKLTTVPTVWSATDINYYGLVKEAVPQSESSWKIKTTGALNPKRNDMLCSQSVLGQLLKS